MEHKNGKFFAQLVKRFEEAKTEIFKAELFTNGLHNEKHIHANVQVTPLNMDSDWCYAELSQSNVVTIDHCINGLIDQDATLERYAKYVHEKNPESVFFNSREIKCDRHIPYFVKDSVTMYLGHKNKQSRNYVGNLILPFYEGVVSIVDQPYIQVSTGYENFKFPTFKHIFTVDILDDFISIYKENLTEGNIKTISTIRDKLKDISQYEMRLKYISLDLLQSIFIFTTANIINPDLKEIIDRIKELEIDILTSEDINGLLNHYD
jgi:hypothetical protein